MTSNRQDQSQATQDPDDLIAELARLVAQDARSASVQSDTYASQEPEPVPVPEARQAEAVDDWYEPEPDPAPGQMQQAEPPALAEYGADAGFGQPAEPEATEPAGDIDPIAGLIADAEVEAYIRDTGEDDAWRDEVEPSFEDTYRAEPEASFEPQPPAAPEPAPAALASDPLSEIEALIGEAARMDAGSGVSGRRVRSSYLDDQPTDAAVNAAESAILAAAAATGAPVNRVEVDDHPSRDAVLPEPQSAEREGAGDHEFIPDPLFAAPGDGYRALEEAASQFEDAQDYEDFEDDLQPRPTPWYGRLGGAVLPVVAGAVIVALLGGVYVVFFSGPSDPGEAPVLTADASPVKQEGEPPASSSESVVFNEIEGNTPDIEEELVSRDQTAGVTGSEMANVISNDEGEATLVNRPVRTVTVRPDGTIVQAEDSVAGSNVLPVDRPNVPDVPNSTLTSDPIGAAIAEAMAGGELSAPAPGALEPRPVADAGGADAVAPGAGQAATPEPVAEVAALDGQTTPLPLPRPTGLEAPATPAPEPTQPEATTPAPTAPAQSATPAGAWVQLSSQRSEDVAQAGIAELQARYGALFNGASPEVSRVDLGERGIYYRVRLPQPSFAEASSVCDAIKGQGGDCFVLNQ